MKNSNKEHEFQGRLIISNSAIKITKEQINDLCLLSENLLLISTFKYIFLYDIENETIIKQIEGHATNISCTLIIKEMFVVITAGFDGFIKVWQIEDNNEIEKIKILQEKGWIMKIFLIQGYLFYFMFYFYSFQEIATLVNHQKNYQIHIWNYIHGEKLWSIGYSLSPHYCWFKQNEILLIISNDGDLLKINFIEKNIFQVDTNLVVDSNCSSIYFIENQMDLNKDSYFQKDLLVIGTYKGTLILYDLKNQNLINSFQLQAQIINTILIFEIYQKQFMMLVRNAQIIYFFNSRMEIVQIFEFFKGKPRITSFFGLLENPRDFVFISNSSGELFKGKMMDTTIDILYILHFSLRRNYNKHIIKEIFLKLTKK